MADEVDELFGEGEGAPKPRTALVLTLLSTGVLLSVLGLLCVSAPGGVLVLFAWMVVEKELDRVDSGYLAQEERSQVVWLRTLTLVGLIAVIGIFVVQGMLLCTTNVYDAWLAWVVEYLTGTAIAL